MITQPNMKVRVNKLLVIATGTYNDQFYRPFRAYLDGGLESELAERLNPHAPYSSNTFSGIATRFIKPDSSPHGVLNIDGGWNKPRMRWIAELEWIDSLGATTIQILTGYTSSEIDLSYANTLDPNLEFFVNNSFMFRVMLTPTPQGTVRHITPISGGQIFINPHYAGIAGQQELLMRPIDIAQISAVNHEILGYGLDADVHISGSMVTNQAKLSRRSNASPATYMSRLLESHRRSYMTNQSQGGDATNIATDTINNAREHNITTDYFLNAISNLNGSSILVNHFNLNLIMQLDPSLRTEDRIRVYRNESVGQKGSTLDIHQPHQTGNSTQWYGSDALTQAAATLAHAIPGIMAECTLSTITFMSNNYEGMVKGFVSAIPHASGFLPDMDLRSFLETFRVRVEDELLFNLSHAHQRSLNVQVYSDILGDTRINLTLDNESGYYVTPTFCDSTFTPIKAYDQQHVFDLGHSFRRAMDITEDHYYSQGQQTTGFYNDQTEISDYEGEMNLDSLI